MISPEEIVALYRARKAALEVVNRRREQVRDAYNGELSVMLPELDRNEQSAVANLVNTGLDQLAMRVASTLPVVECPPRDATKKREVQQANVRRQVLLGWWEANRLPIVQRRRARELLAYSGAPVVVRPDFKRGIPQWHPRSPMGCFPSTAMTPDDMCPDDVVFAFRRTYGWLARAYPEQFERLLRPDKVKRDEKVTLLEYIDADEIVLLVLSDAHDSAHAHEVGAYTQSAMPVSVGAVRPGWRGGARFEVLERTPNRAGICTAVTPGRVTLDRQLGQFDGILGMYAMSAKLMALEVIAVEKGVFPDTYLIGRPGETPKFLTGPHDGRTGLVNIIQGGDIKELQTSPGFQTNPVIDRLERAQRLTAGIPAEFGGESASNVRTGRRGDAVLSAAVDFPVQEQQEILAASLEEENKRAIAVAKGFFGQQPKSFYVNWKGARGTVEYRAAEVFTTDHNVVRFSHAGADLNGLTIMAGQLVGMGAMSKQGLMDLHPLITDPELERDRMVKEELESALRAAVAQKANAGEIAPADLAWLIRQVVTDKMELPEAMEALDKRVSERQASTTGMAQPGSPEAMPGLAAGTSAEMQAMAPIAPPGEGTQNLSSLLGALRRPQMTLASERPAVA